MLRTRRDRLARVAPIAVFLSLAPALTRKSGTGALLLAVPHAGRIRLHRPDGRLTP